MKEDKQKKTRHITKEEYDELKERVKNYDTSKTTHVLDDDLHCPLFPKVDVKKVCEMT